MKIGLIGANGRMCKAIHKLMGNSHDAILYYKECGMSMLELFHNSDVVIDFSSEEGLNVALDCCLETKVPLLSGTTDLSKQTFDKMEMVGKSCVVLWTSNTSLGVFVTKSICKKISVALKEYDIDIFDSHHILKKDAPSGTALSIAHEIESIYDNKLPLVIDSNTPRTEKDIRVHTSRRGLIPGEHEIVFSSDMDEIRIKHTAFSRDLFAKSAIKIAEKMAHMNHFGRLMKIEDIYDAVC